MAGVAEERCCCCQSPGISVQIHIWIYMQYTAILNSHVVFYVGIYNIWILYLFGIHTGSLGKLNKFEVIQECHVWIYICDV